MPLVEVRERRYPSPSMPGGRVFFLRRDVILAVVQYADTARVFVASEATKATGENFINVEVEEGYRLARLLQ